MEADQYYSLDEVADKLKVAYLTVYRWVQDGKLRAHQVGKQYRVSKDDLNTYIEGSKKPAASPKLQDLNKDQLIGIIKQLKRQKKFGLIWEDKPEDVAEQCRKELPVLEQDESKAILADKNAPTNLLIEGDNYHALSVLNYTHARKIDLIYIDPPYNRGGDFRYNDRYIEKEDTFKHSLWLSFISKRLALAKHLLSPNGVMFVSIDDAEFAHLKLLLNDLFGETNVDVMIWKKSGFGRDGKMKNTRTFRKDHEYILVCFNGENKLGKLSEAPDFQGSYGNPDNDPRGEWLSGSISRADYASNPNHPNYYSVTSPTGKVITRQFEITKELFEQLDKEGRISWGKSGNSVPRLKVFISEERKITPYSVLLNKGTTTDGTKEVSDLLKKDCTDMRPKPTSLIDTLIGLGVEKESGIVLDFFAGTGTTGHAVIKHNKKHNTKLQFILCTNNEKNISTDYTFPRIAKVIKGYDNVSGIPANLRYFKTTFVKKSSVSDDTRNELVKRSVEMICVRENTFDKITDKKAYKIYRNADHTTGILFDLDSIQDFKRELYRQKLPAHIYVFSLSNDTYDDDFADLGLEHKLCPIPESILEVYRKLFRKKKNELKNIPTNGS